MSRHVVMRMEIMQDRLVTVQNRKGDNWMNERLTKKE